MLNAFSSAESVQDLSFLVLPVGRNKDSDRMADDFIVRQTLKKTLHPYAQVEVVGEASNGEEALLIVPQLQPTVIMMDIVMPRLDGIASTRLLKTLYPNIAVIGVSARAKSYEVNAMLEAGAFQVITKENAGHDLYQAIQRAVETIQSDSAG